MPTSYSVSPERKGVSNGTTNPAFEKGSTDNGIYIGDNHVKFKDGKEKKEEKENQSRVGVFEMFRFAECRDVIYMAVGTFGAVGLGGMFPVMLLFFGAMIDVFAKFGLVEELIKNINYSDPLVTFNESDVRADFTLLQPWLDATGLNATINLATLQGSVLGELSRLSLIFVGIAFGALACGYLQITFWTMSAERQVWKIRKAFYRAVMRQEIGWFDTNEPGQINTRMTGDIATLKTGLSDKVGGFFQWTAMFLGGIIIGFVQGWKLALVIMAASPLLVIAAVLMSKLMTSLTTMELGAYSKAGAVAAEVLSSMRTVAAFGSEEKEALRYESHLAVARNYGIRRGVTLGLSMAFTFCIFFMSYALGFWYGAKLVAEDKTGEYTAGNVITVFFAIVMGSFSLGQAIPNYQALLRGRGAAWFIYRLIDRVPPIDSYSEEGERPAEMVGDIEFQDVHFNYPSRKDVNVMRGLDLKINNGLTVALVGPSGCGKSTTVQLMQRFYDPDSGKVLLDGHDVTTLNIGWLRQHIGVVSQEPILFDTTITDNIRYGRDDVDQAGIEAACKEANVHDFIASLPEGYNTLVGERGAQLSGGQKQRIAIARALVRDPKILLLDEATSALDTESERMVQQALDKVRLGRTTLIIAHRLSTVQTADRIVAIKDGQIAEEGSHSELMAKKGVYFTLVTTQSVVNPAIAAAAEEDDEDTPENLKSDHSRNSIKRKNEKNGVVLSVDGNEAELPEKEKKEEKSPGGMGRLLLMNLPELPYILIGCVSSLINGGIQPAYAVMFAEFIGVFGETDPVARNDRLTFIIVFFVCLAIMAFITNFLQSVCFARSGEGLTERIRKLVFRAMLKQEVGYFDDTKNNTGALTSRLATEAAEVQGASGARLGMFVQSICGLLTAIVLAFIFGWQLTLVIIGFVPFMIIGGMIEMKIMAGVANRDSVAVEDASKVAVEGVSNIRTVAQLTRERTFCQQYEDRLYPTHKKSLLQAHGMGLGYGLTQSLMYLVYAGAFYFGALFIEKGWMKFDQVFKVFSAIVFGAMGLGQASAFAPDYAKATIAATNIFKLLDRASEIDSSSSEGETPATCTGSVTFKDVRFHYPTRPNLTILKGLSISASSGETIALVGASGCGKSTTVQLLERFYDIEEGQVMIDGHEVSSLNIKWLRSQMGIVSQEPILFDFSLRLNIAYGLKEDPGMEAVIEAARKANIHDFIATLPLGYETRVGDKGTQLSGGQKQRIAIARALIRDPKILLLDEATSALDTESEKVVQEALDKAQEGRTCLVIAHRLSTIKNASKILVFQSGVIKESGTHTELMAKQGIYYKLNSAQTI